MGEKFGSTALLVGDRTPDNAGHRTVRCMVYGKYSGTGHVRYPANIQAPDMSGVHCPARENSRTMEIIEKEPYFSSIRVLKCKK